MSDRKSFAVVIGVIAGVALAGLAIGLLTRSAKTEADESVDDIIARAKTTIDNLSEAVDAIKSSAG